MKTLKRLLRAGLLAVLLAFAAGKPAMAITCDVYMGGNQMRFGTFNLLDGGVRTAVATLSYGCSGASQPLNALICISMGSGPGGSYSPRYLDDKGEKLAFNLYKDASLSNVWGSIDAGGSPSGVAVLLPLPANSGHKGTIDVYGGIATAGQTGKPRGWYDTAYIGGWPVKISYMEHIPGNPVSCNNAFTAVDTTTFYIQAIVSSDCRIDGTSAMDFGTVPGSLDRSLDSQATVTVTCNGTAYRVGLSNGLHAQGSRRRMRAPGGYVEYELYRDANRTARWGNNLWHDGVAQTGNGLPQSLPVYGRVPEQNITVEGIYSDTITVTVEY
jgi:spore coat protein U-like protein